MNKLLHTAIVAMALFLPLTAGAQASETEEGKVYFIRSFTNDSQYMTEEADGSLVVKAQDNAQRQFWQLVPTGTGDGYYYLRNTATGRYIGSCNLPASASSRIATAETPVPYYVWLATSGAVKGGYRLTSTDCADYDNTSKSPRGLNKDGASSNVIAYTAGLSNKNSYWTLTETADGYDLRPFEFSSALGRPETVYSIGQSGSGTVLTMAADGTLTWAAATQGDDQTWYFVGTGNRQNGGFLIANVGTGRTVNLSGETETRWTVAETGDGTYAFRPYATKDDAGTSLTVGGIAAMTLIRAHGAYARSAQIYDLPCGTLGAVYVSSAAISGPAAIRDMAYPLPTVSGTAITAGKAQKPASWFTLYTTDKAVLTTDGDFELNVGLSGAIAEGMTLTAYMDWDADGVFEASQPLAAASDTGLAATIHVPADAAIGETRLRLRLTDNGLTGADDEVTGQVVDFVVSVAAPEDETVSVTSSDTLRGTVAILSLTDEAVSVTATPRGNAVFVCWKDGRRVVSTKASYTQKRTGRTVLVAYFTPNTDEASTAIDRLAAPSGGINLKVSLSDDRSHLSVAANCAISRVTLLRADGKRLATAKGAALACGRLAAGTYLVHVTTACGEAAIKLLVDRR